MTAQTSKTHRHGPNVYTISPGTPFLHTLAGALLDGTLLPENYPLNDPLAMADVTLYLPTRRAVMAMRDVFVELNSSSPALILPQLRALGESDEEYQFFDVEAPNFPLADHLPSAVSAQRRLVILSSLILTWGRTRDAALSAAGRDEPLLVPASPADATWLASDLGGLLDRSITEEIDWRKVAELQVEDYAGFWQMTLEFLKIVTESWPQILKASGEVDAATRRDMEMAAETKRLANMIGDKPVIVAGSTGTLPSTARFIAEIAHLPNGRAVLPGLDLELLDEVWQKIGGPDDLAKAETSHPQYGMKRLLEHFIKAKREIVEPLATPSSNAALRTRIVSEAMKPAEATQDWTAFRADLPPNDVSAAFKNIAFIDAKSDAEEAEAITCALREHVETSDGVACLVTPDRALARRVALGMKRWDINVDDSAGRPLAKAAPAIIGQLIAKVIVDEFEPVALLALVKHPLVAFGLEKGDVRRAARVLDLAVLRGPRLSGGIEALKKRASALAATALSGASSELSEFAKAERGEGERETRHLHPAIKAFNAEDWELVDKLLSALEACLAPMIELLDRSDLTLSDWLSAHNQTLQNALGETDERDEAALLALGKVFGASEFAEAERYSIATSQYADMFRSLLGAATVRYKGMSDPRILILGALEARLLAPDLLILAGLDEGTWPKETRSDAFLSRSMATELGLEPPERRIGLAAHDIQQALGGNRVILSRAEKRSDAPVVASRWVQRLMTLLGGDQFAALRKRGDVYLRYARAELPRSEAKVPPLEIPYPKPPLEARPNRLSVTRIEKLVRDPYAIYGQYILKLREIDPLGDMPDFAERGTIVHKALERFERQWDGIVSPEAEVRLLEIGKALFDEEIADFPQVHALWWPRFERMARGYLTWEAGRSVRVKRRYSEVRAEHDFAIDGNPFRLTAEADRLEELEDHSVTILDFKTGTLPSAKQVKAGLSAQLALEAALFKEGAFGKSGPASEALLSSIGWLKTDGLKAVPEYRSAVEKDTSAEELATLAKERLIELIRRYRNPDQGYAPHARPQLTTYTSPYDHLARVGEWVLQDDGEGQ